MILRMKELQMLKHQLQLIRSYKGPLNGTLGSKVYEPWHDELYYKVLKEISMLKDNKHPENCDCNLCEDEELLKENKKTNHQKVYKPWGWYQDLYVDDNFKTKMLCIHEGKRISLQRHHWRSEVWTIAAGSGSVFCNDEWHLAHPKQTFTIPECTLHRAKALKGDLYIMELQHGKELYEEDIERVEDDYGRAVS